MEAVVSKRRGIVKLLMEYKRLCMKKSSLRSFLFVFLCLINSAQSSAGFLSKISGALSTIKFDGLVGSARQFVCCHGQSSIAAAALATTALVAAVGLSKSSVRHHIRQGVINACLSTANFYCSTKWFNIAKMLGGDLNVPDVHGCTLLYKAAFQGNVKLFKALWEVGARTNLDVVDSWGRTLLCRAVENKDLEIVEALLAAGANPNVKERQGRSAIHYAVLNGDENSIRLLARNNADLHAVGGVRLEDGAFTPLGLAIFQHNARIVQTLLDEGASPELACCSGKNALGAAIMDNNLSIVQLLINHAKETRPEGAFRRLILAGDQFKDSSLHWAVRLARNKNGKKIVNLLLAHGGQAALNLQNNAGQTPLHIAVIDERKPVASLLVRHGADVTIKDARGKSPIEVCPSWLRADLFAR